MHDENPIHPNVTQCVWVIKILCTFRVACVRRGCGLASFKLCILFGFFVTLFSSAINYNFFSLLFWQHMYVWARTRGVGQTFFKLYIYTYMYVCTRANTDCRLTCAGNWRTPCSHAVARIFSISIIKPGSDRTMARPGRGGVEGRLGVRKL